MNKILVPKKALDQIQSHAELSYPEEGAGLLFGQVKGGKRVVLEVFCLPNRWEGEERRKRYLIEAEDMLRAEELAQSRGLEIVGVFHSHPDHPARPSDTDREWALPWYSYVITSVEAALARNTRSWRLKEDQTGFEEEDVELEETIGSAADPAFRRKTGEVTGPTSEIYG